MQSERHADVKIIFRDILTYVEGGMKLWRVPYS